MLSKKESSRELEPVPAKRPSLAVPEGDALWAARLRKEARDEAHWSTHDGGFQFRRLLNTRPWVIGGLRLAGLYERGVRNGVRPVLRRLEFTFPNLPSAFDGFRLLHVSDFHFDGRPGLVDGIVELLAGVEADVCFMTGDYRFECVGPVDVAVESMESILPAIRARHGVYAILGNHDPGAVVEPYRALGIQWLINEGVEIHYDGESIWLAGLDDNHHFRTHDLEKALSGVPSDAFKILLAHSPSIAHAAASAGIDLCLCGHTHAGQIRLPLIGALYSNARARRRYCGGVWRCGNTQGYTTAGIGTTSIPVRFGCPPEAALIRLRRGG